MGIGDNSYPAKVHLQNTAKNGVIRMYYKPRPATASSSTRIRQARINTVEKSKQLHKNDKVELSSTSRKTIPGAAKKEWMALKKNVLNFTSKDKLVGSEKKVKRSSSSPPLSGLNPLNMSIYRNVYDLKIAEHAKGVPPIATNKTWSMSNKVMNVIQHLNPMKLKSFFSKSKLVVSGDIVHADTLKHRYSRENFPKWQEKEIMQGLKSSPSEQLNKILAYEEKWLQQIQHEGCQDRMRLFEDSHFSKKWACLHGTFQGFQNSCYYSNSGELIEKAYRDSPVELGGKMRTFDEVVYSYSYPNYMKYINENGYDLDERPSRVMRVGMRKKNASNDCKRMRLNRTKCLCDFHSLY